MPAGQGDPTNLDSYADGEETPREPDDRDDAFRAIIEAISRSSGEHAGYFHYDDMMEIIDRLIDVADRNIDVTNPYEFLEHAQLPDLS